MKTSQPASLLRSAFAPGDPVSLTEAARLVGGVEQASRALTYLAKRGDYAKVRHRLWVRTGAPVDPYRLGARVTGPYAFAYGSALALHGGTASERSEILVSSRRSFVAFEHEGVAYRRAVPWFSEGRVRVTVGAEFVWTTTPERTLVECVRVPANAGGIAEVLRDAGALPPLRSRELLLWVDRYGEANLAARLGFVLEAGGHRVVQGELGELLYELEQRRPRSRVYLERGTHGGKLLPRWNLIVATHLLPTGIEAV